MYVLGSNAFILVMIGRGILYGVFAVLLAGFAKRGSVPPIIGLYGCMIRYLTSSQYCNA